MLLAASRHTAFHVSGINRSYLGRTSDVIQGGTVGMLGNREIYPSRKLFLSSNRRTTMKSLTCLALLAGVGTLTMLQPASSTPMSDETATRAPASAVTRFAVSPYDCFTDDGYGRKRSCSANYKKKKKKSG